MILGKIRLPLQYLRSPNEIAEIRIGEIYEIVSISDTGIMISLDGNPKRIPHAHIDILLFDSYYKFEQLLIGQHYEELVRTGRFVNYATFQGNLLTTQTLTTDTFSRITGGISAGKTEEEPEKGIKSNNLKLIIHEGYNINVENLLKVFKYIPIRFQGSGGFYDSKYQRLITFIQVKLKSYNYNPYVSAKYVEKVTITDLAPETDLAVIAQMLDIKSLKDCKFIVRNYIDSGRVFKFTNEKKEVLNKEFEALEIALNVKSKNNEEPVNTIILKLPNGNRRFILSDVEIVYPNISGYNKSKDRVIKPNMNVKVIDDKHTIFKKNDVVKTVGVKNLGNKKFAVFFDKNNNEKLYNTNKFKVI